MLHRAAVGREKEEYFMRRWSPKGVYRHLDLFFINFSQASFFFFTQWKDAEPPDARYEYDKYILDSGVVYHLEMSCRL